ncbi:MAG: hypothetical protein ACI855_003903, partial [Myxococcota bacterium]
MAHFALFSAVETLSAHIRCILITALLTACGSVVAVEDRSQLCVRNNRVQVTMNDAICGSSTTTAAVAG